MFEKFLICIYLLLLPFFVQSQDIGQLILNRDYPQALAQIEKGVDENPSAALYFKKGVVLEKMLDFDAAIKALEMACRMDTTETIYLEELAEANSSLGNYMDAIVYLKRAVKLAPVNLMLKGKLAQTYINLKAYPDAYKSYEQIYKLDSTNTYFNRYFAFAAYKVESTPKSVICF